MQWECQTAAGGVERTDGWTDRRGCRLTEPYHPPAICLLPLLPLRCRDPTPAAATARVLRAPAAAAAAVTAPTPALVPRPLPRGSRARARTHTHTHTHTQRLAPLRSPLHTRTDWLGAGAAGIFWTGSPWTCRQKKQTLASSHFRIPPCLQIRSGSSKGETEAALESQRVLPPPGSETVSGHPWLQRRAGGTSPLSVSSAQAQGERNKLATRRGKGAGGGSGVGKGLARANLTQPLFTNNAACAVNTSLQPSRLPKGFPWQERCLPSLKRSL
uniref:Uncharacterized protein LOC110196001 n=1 Tax=Phascolarctos cinereus TaxID=38626 RepID=A0A6P5J1H8_PHACI|nr:uncharacterized protein LOC110196001 [Phascolarctos cinereus]